MRTVYFANAEPIDLSAIAVMGVSVKKGTSPIGYFGTGLKFSIATLLRTGHKVSLMRRAEGGETEVVDFITVPETIRGESFDRVAMKVWGDGTDKIVPLGFTTMLGRNWEDWQAYRELRCNCTDEDGVIDTALPPGEWGTLFIVDGEGIASCHANAGTIFLEGEPVYKTPSIAMHPVAGNRVFYRGVRAYESPHQALFTYNITASTELTEDRTLKYPHMAEWHAVRAIQVCDDEDLIEHVITAPRGSFEAQFDCDITLKPSVAFMNVAMAHRNNMNANRSAIQVWEKHADFKRVFSESVLDDYDEEQIAKALPMILRLGVEITRAEVTVVDSLGEDIYGTVSKGHILIARNTIDKGPRFIASTIYEEHLHKADHYKDESRALQNLLFEKLLTMTERVMALEARQGVTAP